MSRSQSQPHHSSPPGSQSCQRTEERREGEEHKGYPSIHLHLHLHLHLLFPISNQWCPPFSPLAHRACHHASLAPPLLRPSLPLQDLFFKLSFAPLCLAPSFLLTFTVTGFQFSHPVVRSSSQQLLVRLLLRRHRSSRGEELKQTRL